MKMAQVIGALASSWETQIKCPAPEGSEALDLSSSAIWGVNQQRVDLSLSLLSL